MLILEIFQPWGSSLFWKYAKFNLDFKNAEKNWGNIFCFWDNYIWIGCVKLFLLRIEHLWSAVNVLTNSPKILHTLKETFSNWIASNLSINMIKLLSGRFEHCIGRFTMLLVQQSAKRGLFRDFSNRVNRRL